MCIYQHRSRPAIYSYLNLLRCKKLYPNIDKAFLYSSNFGSIHVTDFTSEDVDLILNEKRSDSSVGRLF